MRKNYLWPIILIICGVLMIFSGIASNLGWVSVPLYKIVIAVPLLALTIGKGIIRKKYYVLPITLGALFLLFEKHIAKIANLQNENIISNWIVILSALCIFAGMALLTVFSRKSGSESNSKKESVNLSAGAKYIDCNGFKRERVECNMGSCKVFFSNVSSFSGEGVLDIYNNMGSILITVPKEWTVVSEIENHMGSLSIDTNPSAEQEKILRITGENNMGAVHVKFS